MSTMVDTIERVDINNDIKEPELYDVIFHNDDVTTFEFVIEVMIGIFDYPSVEAAYNFAMKVHTEGQAVAGTYLYEIAVEKKNWTERVARKSGYPLRLSLRKAG